MIRRRLLFALASALTLLCTPAWAQQPKPMPVIGVLWTHAPLNDPTFQGLRAGLQEFGYEEGRNIRFEVRTAAGQVDQLQRLAEELVHLKSDVIVVANTAAVRAAYQATHSTPIVMTGFTADPVSIGVAESFARPGGNVTGIYSLPPELDGKRLEILKEALPDVSRVAVFWDAFSRSQLSEVQRAAQSLGVRLQLIEVRGPQDLETAFKDAKRKKAGAVMLLWSPVFYVHDSKIATLGFDAKLPTVSALNTAVKAGTFISYGADVVDNFRRAAYFVDRLLKGAKASELPIEQPTKFRLVVNLKTAKALGIAIPQSILLRADEVIR